jgi:hypothetical protein
MISSSSRYRSSFAPTRNPDPKRSTSPGAVSAAADLRARGIAAREALRKCRRFMV